MSIDKLFRIWQCRVGKTVNAQAPRPQRTHQSFCPSRFDQSDAVLMHRLRLPATHQTEFSLGRCQAHHRGQKPRLHLLPPPYMYCTPCFLDALSVSLAFSRDSIAAKSNLAWPLSVSVHHSRSSTSVYVQYHQPSVVYATVQQSFESSDLAGRSSRRVLYAMKLETAEYNT